MRELLHKGWRWLTARANTDTGIDAASLALLAKMQEGHLPALPAPIQAYVYARLLATRSPAYLLVRQNGCLEEWGGELSRYGITNLQPDIEVGQQVQVLAGCLPLEGTPLHIPCLETAPGRFADLHIFPVNAGAWVLFLDATAEAVERRLLKQKAHELVLLQEHYATIFGQHLEHEVAHNPVGCIRGAMLTASLLAQIFAALDTVVMERMADGTFRLLSTVPAWLTRLYPAVASQQAGLRPGDAFPFLANFLIDAELFWRTQGAGQLKSGPWSETEAAGREYHLEASALCLGTHHLLCIAFPTIDFAEKQSMVQKAREEQLEHIHRHKALQKKDVV